MSRRSSIAALGELALCWLCACSAADGEAADSGPTVGDSVRLEAEQDFWAEVAICGEAVESYSNIMEAAEDSDAVVVGRLVGASRGNIVQGDAAEDFYAEANIDLAIEESLGKPVAEPVRVSLILRRATRESLTAIIERLEDNLPREPALLLLRMRSDIPGVHRLVGGDIGLWTQTSRDVVDNPIADSGCGGHFGAGLRAELLGDVDDMAELIDQLRR